MEPALAQNQSGIERRGGWRPGAGRPKGGSERVAKWAALEARVRSVSRLVLTREKLLELARADVYRFLERIVLPLIAMEKKTLAAGLRVGVSVSDGDKRTQFVLDFGDGGEHAANDQAGQVLDTLEAFGAEAQPYPGESPELEAVANGSRSRALE